MTECLSESKAIRAKIRLQTQTSIFIFYEFVVVCVSVLSVCVLKCFHQYFFIIFWQFSFSLYILISFYHYNFQMNNFRFYPLPLSYLYETVKRQFLNFAGNSQLLNTLKCLRLLFITTPFGYLKYINAILTVCMMLEIINTEWHKCLAICSHIFTYLWIYLIGHYNLLFRIIIQFLILSMVCMLILSRKGKIINRLKSTVNVRFSRNFS